MLTRGKIMKRILLTSTALVAFAGAAAADVSFSGSAEFSYNDTDAFSSAVELTAAASQALNNGYTASTSITIDAVAGTIADGDISIANDSSSITYHVGNDGVGAASLGGALTKQSSVAGIHTGHETIVTTTTTTTTTNDNDDATITASATVAGATIRGSLHDGNVYEIGVSTDLGGTTINVGMTDGTFGATLGGSTGGVDFTAGFAGDSSYAINASTTAGGADLSLDFGDLGWQIGASMPLGVATVGVTLDDAQAWEVSVDTSLDAIDVGFTFDSASAWTMSAGYAANDMSFTFATDNLAAWSLDATYDMGNGITAGAGTDASSNQYVEVDYDLGGGANLSLDYATAAEVNPAEDIKAGTTVSVSFSF